MGGNGGVGGAGGALAVSFNGNFVPDANSDLATFALMVSSLGAQGGDGGLSSTSGIFYKEAGDAGAGGAGGAISLTASGTIGADVVGIMALSLGGRGGGGGLAETGDKLDDTIAGDGGTGGAAGTVSVQWTSGAIRSGSTGALLRADGGQGGGGGQAINGLTTTGGNAGAGGNGGGASLLLAAGTSIAATQPGFVTGSGAGISVLANGGDGGDGGYAGRTLGSGGGSGGNGGAGGTAAVTILGSVTYTGVELAGQINGQGVRIQANGGAGGAGAGINALIGQAGGGGFAGAGGSATLNLGSAASTGTVRASGSFAHGALVQSVGGSGGDGGNASFGGSGGAGEAGGDGGPVTVNALNALVVVAGNNAIPVLAQSIGGGGGSGGNVSDIAIGAQFAIGGNGGIGGHGGTVDLRLTHGVFASTAALGGAGLLAQSIGGSGGNGGSAASTGVGLISMVVGGDAGGGGAGGGVTITSNALVTTYGDHASGIHAQSIGGGGGKGGAAVSFLSGVLPTASIAIGGRGGSGGPAGGVSVTNTAQVTSYGPDAHGVVIQSIGGGGGTGGAAAARSVDVSPNKDIPALSLSVALGGAGGSGNTGGTVALGNAGLITTAGHGAFGVIAQSVGGGGGSGGDSTASAYSGGSSQGSLSISISVAIGGTGGTGGTGGQVNLSNTGLIATMGQDAHGVFAQSVGGGGGAGGGGDATSASNEAKGSFSTSVGVGGTGGTGGHAGTVGLTSSGAITTRGDGATGVFAQSVGGGGGAGGGGTATASGGNLAIAVGVGGSGGAGGDGNTATVRNSGSVVTRGTDAIAVMVQSVGGGGGTGGKGGATAGGVSTLSNAQALFDILSAGLNFNQTVTDLGDGILQIGQIGEDIQATADELRGIFSQPQSGDAENGTSVHINVAVAVGGSGGAAGAGGPADVTNTGTIQTFGAQSDGIYAQSVGGGGGSGGGATSTAAASDDTPAQTAIGVGGRGGGGGAGGPVTVINGAGGAILTQGVAAFAILAQSVGGGGGEGAAAGAISGSFGSLSVGVGGSGGTGGNGGDVSVTTGNGTATGSTITTTGKHGIGILAQSIGGGGGLARTMTTDQTFDPSKIVNNPQGRVADLHGLTLSFGGQKGIAGDGGAVLVTASGPVTTSGLDAHGIVTQSIGAGGGMVVGGQVLLPVTQATGGASGRGGAVTVLLNPGAAISTAGDGAHGVIAQSIGGGGGFAGDPSSIGTYATAIPNAIVPVNAGNGGTVAVTANGALIQTTGNHAPAIFAQSVGGGGGLVNYVTSSGAHVQARGSAGGPDGGGGAAVTVSLAGSRVLASGAGSAGILAQSAGAFTGQIRISIDANSQVHGGTPDPNTNGQDREARDGAAIRLLGGTNNLIENAGQIVGLANGLAILTDTAEANTTVSNTGTITGDIIFSGGGLVENRVGGVIAAPTLIDLGGGVLRNAGALHVGGTGRIGTTVLGGDLVQSGSGRLVVETDHGAGSADRLQVQGSARLGGTVEVRPVRLANAPVTVLTATQGLALDPGLAATRTHLFRFDLQQQGAALRVQPAAEFTSATGAAGSNQLRVAEHLQQIWESGARFDAGFTALGTVEDAGGYGRALDTLSGQTLGAIAAWRFVSSMNFVSNMQSCPVFIGDTMAMREDECAWARVTGNTSTQNATGGSLGYAASAETAQIGRQWALAPNWFLGLSVGYESSRFTGDAGTSRVTGDALAAGVALKHQMGRWLVSATLDAGHGEYDSTRRIEVGSFTQTATASPNAWHVGGTLRASYQMVFDDFYLRPLAELRVIHVQNDGFTETGAGPFNLAVSSASSATVAGSAGVEFGKRIAVGAAATLHLYGGVGVTVLGDDGWAATARFADAPGGSAGFRATTPIPDVLGRLVVGANLYTAGNWEMRLQYNGDAGDDFTSHTGTARLAYRF